MDTTIERQELDVFLKRTVYSDDFPTLWRFPREFKRNWFKQFDARFIIILSLTFFVEVGMILFFLSRVKGSDKQLDVTSIQKRYAHLLLNKYSEDHFFDDTESTGTYLYGVPEETAPSNLVSGSQQNVSNIYTNSSPGTDSDRNNEKRPASNGRQSDQGTAGHAGGGSAAGIGSLGLLQYISDDDATSNEELREILAQGDRSNQYLEGSLANVKLGSYGQTGGASSTDSDEQSTTFYSGIKGSKTNVSNAELRSSVAPLEKVNYSTVAKNTELEESSASILNRTGSKASARKAEHVTRIVINHNRSIQDCYKQALKKQPDLKGKLVVRFSVTPSGTVDQVVVIRSTIDYEPLIRCIKNRILRWNDFGESDISLGTVSYRQTYVFGY